MVGVLSILIDEQAAVSDGTIITLVVSVIVVSIVLLIVHKVETKIRDAKNAEVDAALEGAIMVTRKPVAPMTGEILTADDLLGSDPEDILTSAALQPVPAKQNQQITIIDLLLLKSSQIQDL